MKISDVFKLYVNDNAIKAGVESGNKGILKSCVITTAQAKLLCPVDEGQLRNSISYSAPNKNGNEITGGLNDASGEQAEKPIEVKAKNGVGYVGSNVDHMTYIEFGTVNMAAQPTLRPAVELTFGRSLNEVFKDMGTSYSDALKRGKAKKV